MTRARSLARLGNSQALSVDSNLNVGVNSTSPVSKLNVVGVVSATAYYGDGSNLEGVASAGLGTAIGDTGAASVIYYTDTVLSVGATVNVDVPNSAKVAYTQYQEIAVEPDAEFIVADGDEFVPDILGISSTSVSPGLLAGGGGVVRADNFTNKAGSGSPTFPNGAVVTGVATATSFSGNVTGNATGLSGSPDLNVGIVTATSFEGDGSALTNLNIPASFNELDAALFN